MRHLLFFLTMTVFVSLPRSGAAAVDHGPWSALLARYVDDNGRVAYRNLFTEDRATFEKYLTTLAQARTEGMSEADDKAFWLNAYNAVIVSGVLQGHTAEGVLARKRLFSWFTVPVAGKSRSPDEIEHQILRKQFHDPRIHFAIVCASSSCPKLRREAYVPERLDLQLDEATRAFVNDPSRNRIEPQRLGLSRIFEWFADDFMRDSGSVSAFVQRFVDGDKKTILSEKADALRYLDYDWTLNAQEGQRV
jgi:hypothetical protein